jgi:hypothetical protein
MHNRATNELACKIINGLAYNMTNGLAYHMTSRPACRFTNRLTRGLISTRILDSNTPIKLGYRQSSTTAKTGEQSNASLGRRYEERCQTMLRTIGIATRHVGGCSDGGVDLRGSWDLSPPLTVLVQCKYLRRACPPSHVRELEGTVSGEGVLGVLISMEGASRASIERMAVSEVPMMLLHYDMVRLKSAFVNKALQRLAPKLVIGSKHVDGQVEPVFFISD